MIEHLYFIFDFTKAAETINLNKQHLVSIFKTDILWIYEIKRFDQRKRVFENPNFVKSLKKIPKGAIFANMATCQ